MGAKMSASKASQVATSQSSAGKSTCSKQKPCLKNDDSKVDTMRIAHHLGHVRINKQRRVRATFNLGDR
jgi:hypothetical protein